MKKLPVEIVASLLAATTVFTPSHLPPWAIFVSWAGTFAAGGPKLLSVTQALTIEHAELEAARTGVDNQDAHPQARCETPAPSPPGQIQSRTSGESSPTARV